MEKLCSGGLASSMKDVGKTVKSFPTKHVFTTLLLMLLCMMLPKTAWAQNYESTETYDFATYATAGGSVVPSSTTYTGITAANVADKLTASGQTDLNLNGRFAFRSKTGTGARGWILTTASGGLRCVGTDYTPELAIRNLRAGDRVKITFNASTLKYLKQNTDNNNNTITGVNLTKGNDWNSYNFNADDDLTSGQEYIVLQDGDLLLKAGGNTTITKIEIRAIKDAKFSISSTKTSDGTPEHSFQFTQNGRMAESVVTVPYMTVEFGNPVNTPIVRDNKVEIPDENGWEHLWASDGKPYQGTFYVFKPTASGKLWIKGSLDNTQMELLEYDENGTYKGAVWTASSTGDVTIGWIDVKKNHVYYLVEGYNFMTTGQNQKWTKFKLAEFKFQNTFTMGTLGLVLENGATSGTLSTLKNSGSLTGWNVRRTYDQTGDKVSDNIDTSDLSVTVSGNTLTVSGIKYNDESADKGGVIVLDLNFENGDAIFVVTIPYSAEKGHKWDFYSNVLQIGQYKTTGSQLQQETDNGEWKYTYRVINNQGVGTHDPMYQNVYDMEGDNADMIWETEGLIFNTPAYKSCLYNEIDADAQATYTKGTKTWTGPAYTDRYVGILPGGSFTIPGLKKNDRVLIEMGSGDGSSNDVCFLNITNARDAVGNPINSSDTYKAGGSVWNGINEDYNLRGYYHFIAAADGDMTFTMNDGSMTKLYTIEIYQGDHKYTDDATRVSSVNYGGVYYNAYAYQLLNDYKSDAKNAAYQLHYRGKGDGLRNPTVIYKTGNVGTGTDKLWYQKITSSGGSTNHYILFKSTKGEFGMFRMRIDMMEQGNKYVADYGLQNVSVGYLEKKDYPYTWDFTDMSGYCSEKIAADITASNAYDTAVSATDKYDTGGDPLSEFMNRQSPIENNGPYYNTVALWKEYSDDFGSGYGLQVRNNYYANNNSNEGSGELTFTSGSQLFAGDSFIAEAAGLGLIANGSETKRNGRLRITEDGLFLYEQQNNYWRVRIPEVPSTSAVYVRAKEIPGRSDNVKVTVGDASTIPTYAKKIGEDEWVYAMKGTGQDMTFFFSNVIVEKIAVSEDAKKVNSKGWTSESRSRNIDASLTAYMTGKDIKTYLVSNPDYKNRTLTLTDVGADASNYVLPANTGCVMYNATDNAAADILDGGFHLFVPDMHDTEKVYNVTETNNLLTPNVSSEISLGMRNGSNVNYVLAYKYQQLKEDGTPYGDVMEGPEMFYRVSKSGIKLRANSAYLQLPEGKVHPDNTSMSAGAKFTFIFADELENDSQATGIEDIPARSTSAENGQPVWYNLNGQKLNGKPQQRGLYIVNGKKVLFK